MKYQLKIGFLGLIILLAIMAVFTIAFQLYSERLRAEIVWHDLGSNGVELQMVNRSSIDWYDLKVSIKYDGVEYLCVWDRGTIQPGSITWNSGGNFVDENGNAVSFRTAMDSEADIEIAVKKAPGQEYEPVKIIKTATIVYVVHTPIPVPIPNDFA